MLHMHSSARFNDFARKSGQTDVQRDYRHCEDSVDRRVTREREEPKEKRKYCNEPYGVDWRPRKTVHPVKPLGEWERAVPREGKRLTRSRQDHARAHHVPTGENDVSWLNNETMD